MARPTRSARRPALAVISDPAVVRDVGRIIDEVAMSAARRRSPSPGRWSRRPMQLVLSVRARQSSS